MTPNDLSIQQAMGSLREVVRNLGEQRPAMKVRIAVTKLLPILQENRKRHHDVFLEATNGYRAAVIKQLEEHIENIKSGKKIQQVISFVQPVNQTADYDRVISMLQMSADPELVLEENEFRCYVQDKWSWARQFSTSNKLYTSSQVAAEYYKRLEGDEEEE